MIWAPARYLNNHSRQDVVTIVLPLGIGPDSVRRLAMSHYRDLFSLASSAIVHPYVLRLRMCRVSVLRSRACRFEPEFLHPAIQWGPQPQAGWHPQLLNRRRLRPGIKKWYRPLFRRDGCSQHYRGCYHIPKSQSNFCPASCLESTVWVDPQLLRGENLQSLAQKGFDLFRVGDTR